jgi:hypothetical protein
VPPSAFEAVSTRKTPPTDNPDKPSRLEAALDEAIATGSLTSLLDVLERRSNLPGTKPNLEFARAAGIAIAARRGKADGLVRSLFGQPGEYPLIVGAQVLAQRALAGVDARRSMEQLHDMAGEPRHLVRIGVISAVRDVILARSDDALSEFAAWTDGYLHAHVVLEALADRQVLDKLRSPQELLARLNEAFVLADESPRAAERSQGLRSLREAMPTQVAVMAARFGEVIDWVAEKTAMQRPETRDVVRNMIVALRKANLKDAEASRLLGALDATAKPLRNQARVVEGTRKRSKGRL